MFYSVFYVLFLKVSARCNKDFMGISKVKSFELSVSFLGGAMNFLSET